MVEILLNTNQKKIRETLLKIEGYESSLRKRSNKKNNDIYNGGIAICFILITFSLILIGITFFYKNEILAFIALALILFSGISLILSTFIDMYISRKDINSFFNNPSAILLRNSNLSTRSKLKYIQTLFLFELSDLKFAKREIAFEKDHFDKRTSIITGTIDKIGIFPTILATLILILTQLSNTNVQNFLNLNPNFKFYFFAAIFIVFFFQVFSVINSFTSLKLFKMIDTLDYVIEIKKEKE